MPELPEVETVKNALKTHLTNRTITQVEIFTPAMREPLTPLLSDGLPGKRIIEVRRRGKYFLLDLDDNRTILGHLGMSGVVRVEKNDVPKRKHEHVFIHLDNDFIFRFECTRRFSLLKVCALEPNGYPGDLQSLGVEPLTPEFDGEYLYTKSRRKHGALKSFIMDNAVVVGVGNIYAAESLFAAALNPLRHADELTPVECDRLCGEIKRILLESIELGGSTISDFKHVDGSEGKFAQRLLIYGREGEACPICGAPIQMERIGGRSSCFCPRCQK